MLISTTSRPEFQQAVKLKRSTLAAVGDRSHISRRLFLTDRSSGSRYLIDTGADISVIPPSYSDRRKKTDRKLYAANGTSINIYGERLLVLSLGLRRNFTWNFVIADVQSPIIGADFIHHYNLLVDLKNRRLIDPLTSASTPGSLIKVSGIETVYVMPPDQQHADILKKFPNLLQENIHFDIPDTTVFHTIVTEGHPVAAKARRLPPHKLKAAKAEFQQMINMKICQPSKSAWASPLHLVPKKDGSWRPCGDYRALNNITKPDRYPIPNLQDFNSQLHGKQMFSKIDLVRAYHHIPVHPDDVPKTAVITR